MGLCLLRHLLDTQTLTLLLNSSLTLQVEVHVQPMLQQTFSKPQLAQQHNTPSEHVFLVTEELLTAMHVHLVMQQLFK